MSWFWIIYITLSTWMLFGALYMDIRGRGPHSWYDALTAALVVAVVWLVSWFSSLIVGLFW